MKFLKDNIIVAAFIGAVGAIVAGVTAASVPLIASNWEKFFPNQTSTVVPLSLAQGDWEITEKGKYLIVWKYKPNLKDNNLELRGRKIKVNHKDPEIGDKIAESVCNLKFKGSQSEGECQEFTASGTTIITNAKLTFTDNFTSVTGYFENNGRRGPILIGTKL
jgi:hypothetical protein